MKLAGNTPYKFIAYTPSDSSGLGFNSLIAAELHAAAMNLLLDEFETNPIWNKEYWPIKPAQWVAKEIT